MPQTPPRQGWSVADRYSPEEITAVMDLYRSGASAAAVAEAAGLSVSTVRRLVRKHVARRKDQNGTYHRAHVHLGGLAACRTSA